MIRGPETNIQPQLVQTSRRTSIGLLEQFHCKHVISWVCMQMFSCTIITPPSSLPSQLWLGSWPLSLSASKPQRKSSSCKSLKAEFTIHKMRTFYTLSLPDMAALSTLWPAQSQSRAPHYLLPRKGTLPQPQPAQGGTLT